MRPVLLTLLVLSACFNKAPVEDAASPTEAVPVVEEVEELAVGDCSQAKNVCPDYSIYWKDACPEGERCLTFTNASTTETVKLAYNIGCNGDGSAGAPQCACTTGPELEPGKSMNFQIVDGNYESCLPSWQPPCLTVGLAVMGNTDAADCTKGTRVEYSAGNEADIYGKFDSYNIDVEKEWYSIPVSFKPDLECASDHANHDCRPLWCGKADCPDAYGTPTSGGCEDGRSPQGGCQDTFNQSVGYTVTYFPEGCDAETCPSCQDANPC